jgi:hypothetical protein
MLSLASVTRATRKTLIQSFHLPEVEQTKAATHLRSGGVQKLINICVRMLRVVNISTEKRNYLHPDYKDLTTMSFFAKYHLQLQSAAMNWHFMGCRSSNSRGCCESIC